jgi:hypothetical protein
MNVKVKDGVVTVTLLKPEEAILAKARNIGVGLAEIGQAPGMPLVDAVNAILMPLDEKPEEVGPVAAVVAEVIKSAEDTEA